MEASEFQLIPKVAGSRAQIRVERWSLPLPEIRTSFAQKCLGGKCAWPDHRAEGERESDLFIFTMELLYSGMRKKKKRDRESRRLGDCCFASLPHQEPLTE